MPVPLIRKFFERGGRVYSIIGSGCGFVKISSQSTSVKVKIDNYWNMPLDNEMEIKAVRLIKNKEKENEFKNRKRMWPSRKV